MFEPFSVGFNAVSRWGATAPNLLGSGSSIHPRETVVSRWRT